MLNETNTQNLGVDAELDSYTPSLGGITYQDLLDFHTSELDAAGKNQQTRKNRVTALNRWLDHVGKGFNDEIGDDLVRDLKATLDEHLATIKETSQKARRHHINAWSDALLRMQLSDGLPDDFGAAFRELKKSSGLTYKTLAKDSGISESVLKGWAKTSATRPSHKGKANLHRLEKVLRVSPGTLKNRLPRRRPTRSRLTRDGMSAFGQRIFDLQKEDNYRLHEPVEGLESEWRDLLDFYTSEITPIGFNRNSTWRLKDPDKQRDLRDDHCYVRGRPCPSSCVKWQSLAAFFGFLMLDKEKGGVGLNSSELSLAQISSADLVWAYLQWRRDRSGVFTSETQNFLKGICGSFLRKDTGWLWQNPSFRSKVYTLKGHSPVAEADWAHWCETNRKKLLEIAKDLDSSRHIKKGRDPEAPIQNILSMQRPINALFTLLERIEEDRPPATGSPTRQAVFYRDQLLANMLCANPLRINMYGTLTWKEDGTGSLRKTGDGEWRLAFTPDHFKNERGAACKPYDVPVARDLWPMIEAYIEKQRPVLLDGVKSDVVFVTAPTPTNEHRRGAAPRLIGRLITTLTRKYIPDLAPNGFGPQAIRHIIATDYLKNNPNGFQVAADILHDKLETVIKHYAHLKVADGISNYLSYRDSQKAQWRAEGDVA